MAGNRKAAEALVLKLIGEMIPGDQANIQIYKDLFAGMDDKNFEAWVEGLESGRLRLAIVAPNLAEKKITIENNLALAKKYGHEFFERLVIDPGNETPPYLSYDKYLVVDLPLRRQAQLLVKKISIPQDNKSIDDLTGQPTAGGKSRGSKLSYPEIQIMAALELDENVTEMIKYRGGDVKGFNAMNDAIAKTGGVSLKTIEHLGTKVKSTETLSTFLTCMHISNTL